MIDGISGEIKEETSLDLSVGTRVSYGGMEGTVVVNDPTIWHGWPIEVKFDAGPVILFTEDGRQYRQQSYSSLKVIGKVRPKVKRWQWLQKSKVTGEFILTSGVYTDEEAREFESFIRKIEETEVTEEL